MERQDPADALGESGRRPEVGVALPQLGVELLQEVGIAGQAKHGPGHRAHVDLVRLPPEDRAVEPLRAIDVARVELAEIPGTGHVHRLGAFDGARLPEAERGARCVGAHGHSAQVANVESVNGHGSARLPHLGDTVIGIVHRDVCVPGRRRRPARDWSTDRGHVLPIERRDEVRARFGRHPVLKSPIEESSVEDPRRIGIGLVGVDPCRHAGRKSIALAHALPPGPK